MWKGKTERVKDAAPVLFLDCLFPPPTWKGSGWESESLTANGLRSCQKCTPDRRSPVVGCPQESAGEEAAGKSGQ